MRRVSNVSKETADISESVVYSDTYNGSVLSEDDNSTMYQCFVNTIPHPQQWMLLVITI